MNEKGSAQESIAVTPKINHITSLLSHWCFLRHGRNLVGVQAGFVRKVARKGELAGGAAGRGGDTRGGGLKMAQGAAERSGAAWPGEAAWPPAPFFRAG